MNKKMKEKLYRIICSSILLIIAVILKNVNNIVSIILFGVSYLVIGYDILLKAIKNTTQP